MKSYFNKIKDKSKSDLGAAIVILGLFCMIALVAIGGLLVDSNKAVAARGQIKGIAQVSAKSGIRYQTGRGGLSHLASTEAVEFYMKQLDTNEVMVYRGNCNAKNDNKYPIITVGYKKSEQSEAEHVKVVSGPNAKVTYTLQEQNAINNGLYKTLTFTVEDCIRNYYLPGTTIVVTDTPATMIKGDNGQ